MIDTRLHRPLRFSALAAGIAIVCAASAAQADDWAAPGLDAAHSRLSAERSGAAFGAARWSTSFKTSGRVLASPVVADGFVVSVDLDGLVTALRADDGTPVWQAPLGSDVHGSPAAARGRVFVPTFGNKVVALSLANGSLLWASDVGGSVLSSPTPLDGDIVVSAGFPTRHVVRLAGDTGKVVWQSPEVMQQFSNTSPAVGGDLVVVGTNGGRYYAFDATTGALRWDYAADGLVNLAAPLISGGRVFMAGGGDSHSVHAVDAATGAAVPGWPIDLPTPDPDVTGTLKGRHRAISSFTAVGGQLILQTRLDDALDTNNDGAIDDRLSREIVVSLDAATGQVVWQVARGRSEVADPNDVPKFLVCPTPAAFAADGGAPLIASASSLGATMIVLDAATGSEQARVTTAGATLASPVLANGRLYSVAMNGTVEGLASSVNHAPGAAIPARAGRAADAADFALHWLPALDPDGELPTYEIRIDSDGEILTNWQQQILVPAGTTSAAIGDGLAPGTYTFAIRARDSHGALSPWSALEGFTIFKNPPVTVGGVPATSLVGAVAGAKPGDVIMLGAGTYTLADTLHVGAGVSLQGAGAGRTVLNAAGLAVGVSFDGTDANQRAGLDGVTVTGADTCINVAAGSTGIGLSHLIVRDCRTNGVAVAATGGAKIVNATIVGNGAGVSAAGSTTVRNSLFTSNGVALSSAAVGALASTYNDLFGNDKSYAGLEAGTGDLSTAVAFADLLGRSLRLLASQPSTDRGDPGDPVGDEPVPNGGRINLGAFGGTADAETSALSTAVGGSGVTPNPTTDPTPPTPPGTRPETPGADDGGCAVSGHSRPDVTVTLLGLLGLVLVRRRRARRR